MLKLDNWFRQSPEKPMLIDFYSPGGDVVAGLALYDRIKELQKRGAIINTKATGMAASMSAVLLQAGTERACGANAYIMLHELAGEVGGSFTEMADQQKFLERLHTRLENILLERAKLTKAQLKRRVQRKDYWLDAPEALELGLIDRIEE